jgi:hypothetical protein
MNNYEHRPPLGSPPDFEALDRANAEYNARLEHIPLSNFPELVHSSHAIIQGLSHIRTRLGVSEMPTDISIIRLMNRAQWSTLHSNESGADAHYDPLSGNVYHLFDERHYSESKVTQMMTVYTLGHELSHKTTHGLETYSFNLSEGMADFLTQQVLEMGALSPVISKETLDLYRHQYLAGMESLIIDGDEFKAKDIFVVPNERGSGFTRIPQLRLIEALQTALLPGQFNDFLKGALTADISLVRDVLRGRFGRELADNFEGVSGQTNPHLLTKNVLDATPL